MLRYATPFRYTSRETKAMYVAQKYAPLLTAGVLDVGCWESRLRPLLPPTARYVGVDMLPGADVVLNLDRDDLPFADRSFDTVLCTDVLEHLDRCHRVFDELCRVASGHVIVALPNPAMNFLMALLEGSGGRLKHYGLPAEAPADRHRWFFGHEDAERFLTERGAKNGFGPEQIDAESVWSPPRLEVDGRNVFDHPNLRRGTLWAVLARRDL